MAVTAAELLVKLGWDDKELEKGSKESEGKIKAFGGRGKAAVLGAVAGIGAAVGGAFAFKEVIGQFASFESSMNEVFTLLPGISKEAMGQMSDQVKTFSKEFGVLPDEVVPALYQSLSAGVPEDNVFSFLETAQMAAKGGVTDLTTAVDGITSVTNAYGEEVLSASKASDLMFTAVKLGKTDFSQLSRSIFNVTPIASALGVEFGDVTAGLAALTAQGVPTSVATTQMRQMFVELSKEGSKTSDTFKELSGQSFKDFVASGGDTQQALQMLEAHAGDLGVGINDLFGSVEAGSAALALTGKGTEAFSDALAEMQDSAGATEEAFDTMSQGLGPLFDRFRAWVAVTAIELGEKLAPAVEAVAGWVTSNLIPALSKVAGVIGEKVVPVFAFVREAFNLFVEAFKNAGPGIRSEAEDGWVNAIETFGLIIGNVFGWIKDNIPPLVQRLKDFGEAVIGAFKWFIEDRQRVIAAVGGIGAILVGLFVSWAVSAAAAAAATLLAAAPVIALAAGIAILVGGLIYAWNNFETFRTVVTTVFEVVKEVITTVIDVVVAVITGFVNGITALWDSWGDTIMNVVSRVFGQIRIIIDTVLGIVRGIWNIFAGIFTADFNRVWSGIAQIVSSIWGGIRDSIGNALGAIWDFVLDIGGRVVQWFVDLPGRMAGIFSGMFDGIKAAFKAAINWVIQAWNNLSFTVPSVTMPGILGGGTFGGQTLSTPNIPQLALGGSVLGSGLALVGEAGPELLRLPRGAQVEPLGSQGDYNDHRQITIHMPPGSDGDDVVDALKRYERRNGPVPITVRR